MLDSRCMQQNLALRAQSTVLSTVAVSHLLMLNGSAVGKLIRRQAIATGEGNSSQKKVHELTSMFKVHLLCDC